MRFKFPILLAISATPIAAVFVPFMAKAHGNAIVVASASIHMRHAALSAKPGSEIEILERPAAPRHHLRIICKMASAAAAASSNRRAFRALVSFSAYSLTCAGPFCWIQPGNFA